MTHSATLNTSQGTEPGLIDKAIMFLLLTFTVGAGLLFSAFLMATTLILSMIVGFSLWWEKRKAISGPKADFEASGNVSQPIVTS